MADPKEIIASRIAKELKDGYVVNLGIGTPTLVTNYIPDGIEITLQSENGIMGMGPLAVPGDEDTDIINAGAQYVTVTRDASYFDSAVSFGMIRGGHVDLTVLGALQVDEQGNLANHIIPGKLVPGMGGAMDLAAGAKRVIVATTHTAKGEPKILKRCTLPVTALGKVGLIVTELAVIEVTHQGLLLKEIAPYTNVKEVQRKTEAELIVSKKLKYMM